MRIVAFVVAITLVLAARVEMKDSSEMDSVDTLDMESDDMVEAQEEEEEEVSNSLSFRRFRLLTLLKDLLN